jgi:hypothetical protein
MFRKMAKDRAEKLNKSFISDKTLVQELHLMKYESDPDNEDMLEPDYQERIRFRCNFAIGF